MLIYIINIPAWQVRMDVCKPEQVIGIVEPLWWIFRRIDKNCFVYVYTDGWVNRSIELIKILDRRIKSLVTTDVCLMVPWWLAIASSRQLLNFTAHIHLRHLRMYVWRANVFKRIVQYVLIRRNSKSRGPIGCFCRNQCWGTEWMNEMTQQPIKFVSLYACAKLGGKFWNHTNLYKLKINFCSFSF